MKFNPYYTKIATNDSLMETVQHGTPRYPFQFYYEELDVFDFHCIEWHWHPELEFVYVKQGPVSFWVGQDSFELRTGEAIFINSAVLHRLYAQHSGIIPNFLCYPTFLAPEHSLIYQKYVEPVLASELEYVVMNGFQPWHREALRLIEQIIDLHDRHQEEDQLLVSAELQLLWNQLWHNSLSQLEEDRASGKGSGKARLQRMMQYIQEHYRDNITLEQIAASADVSKSTAANLFRDILHTTPVRYLIQIRLQSGAELLLSGGQSVGAIAAQCGFDSVDYFCKTFKKHYGKTPTEYRKAKLSHGGQR